ncbi:MAG: adenylate kinase [Lentisphaeria bacterium]|nr:adenylate kinase [Lentisphaeria bacterium]
MITKKNLVLLGPPGAGKGTLSDPLMAQEKLAHISTGEILRGEVAAGTELGKQAEACMKSGKLVPDQVVADMVAARLATPECAAGFILDGFPRTVAQAELLEDAMARIGMKLDAVILFEAPEDLLLQRLTARLTCKKCGVAFNKLFAPPKQEGVCDRCGGELIQRADDSLETAKNRLKVYHEQTAPLIQFYEGKGCLARIDSSLPVREGFAALLALLK